jgi:hypothetical protein
MAPRTRLLSFGAGALTIVAGLIAGPLLGGITGEAVAISLFSVGGITIVSLVFLEIGLSEDRDRERELASSRLPRPAARLRRPRRRRRPD